MRTRITILLMVLLAGIADTLHAQYPDGKEILLKIDKNMSADTRIFSSTMIIHGKRGSREIQSKTWSMGDQKAFTEYLSPAREKGNKMLKLEDALWIFSPSTDRTIKISGHMLRQSVMGSDMSYEDMMEDHRLLDVYDAEVTGEENLGEKACWKIELKANRDDLAYQKRIQWVDKQKMIPLKEELYAKSGKLLKRTELSDIRKVDGRWYPYRVVFKDMLKAGDGTEFIIQEISFNSSIPESIFNKANLN